MQRPVLRSSALEAASTPRVAIEAVSPVVDVQDAFRQSGFVGDIVTIEADILCDGHDQLAACVHWREPGNGAWNECRMQPSGNDRWAASIPLARIGRHEFAIEAWRDAFATFREELRKKHEAGVDVRVELIEGRRLAAEAGAPLPHIEGQLGRRT